MCMLLTQRAHEHLEFLGTMNAYLHKGSASCAKNRMNVILVYPHTHILRIVLLGMGNKHSFKRGSPQDKPNMNLMNVQMVNLEFHPSSFLSLAWFYQYLWTLIKVLLLVEVWAETHNWGCTAHDLTFYACMHLYYHINSSCASYCYHANICCYTDVIQCNCCVP